jgi:type I restriction enzyme, S subunit
MKYGLDENQLCEIVDIFRKYPEVEEAILFGSRAIGTYKEASDIDIAIKGKDVSVILATKIQSDLEDTYLPFFFDIISFPSITNQDLIKHINTKGISIYRAGWKKCKLGDVVVMHYGKALPSGKRIKGDIPVYGSAGIIGYHNEPLSNTKGLIIGRKGNIGCVYKSMEPFFAIDTTFYVQPNDDLYDMDYLYYMLLNYRFDLLNEDSAVPGLNRKTAYFQDIYLPPLHKQKEIASILSCLDDKIDLLHRQNKTLESIAQTLFHQWFIKEADEKWEYRKIEDIATIKGGGTPSTRHPFFWDGDICFVTPRDLTNSRNGGFYLANTDRKISEKGLEKIKSGLLPTETLLLSSRAPIGLLTITDIPVSINQGLIAVIDNKGLSKEFLYLWLKENMPLIHSYANGSTFQEISKSSFKSIDVLVPEETTLSRIQEAIKPLFMKIKVNTGLSMKTYKLRSLLLEKLLSYHE